MAPDRARRGVIAGDGEHVGLFAQQDWQRRVQFLNRLDLRAEVSVLAGFVGVLVVDEEVIVAVELSHIALELFGDVGWPFDLRHPDQLRQAFVHWVDGQGRGPQAVAIREGWNRGLMRDAAQKEAVGGFLFRQQRQRRLVEIGDELRRFFLFR